MKKSLMIDEKPNTTSSREGLIAQATSSSLLEIRLKLNKKYSSNDFTSWLFARLDVNKNEDILDVGCGTGAQTIPFLDRVGDGGSVSCIDISSESIDSLLSLANYPDNLDAIVADMSTLQECISSKFRVKKYDLVHSSYSLYYADSPATVLNAMKNSLKPNGRLAVFTPNSPHGMVDFVRQFYPIPAAVDASLSFGASVLEPFFKTNFLNVVIHLFNNTLRIPGVDDFMGFYRATTYWEREKEPIVISKVTEIIDKLSYFEYQKNGYLIIGRDPLQNE